MRPSAIDRRAGAAVRRAVAARPRLARAARVAAGALSPGFRGMVGVLVVLPPTRRAGLRALAAGVGAGVAARLLRDAIARPRPGRRPEGGFPSRHAAAAVAIAAALGRAHPAARGLWALVALGLAARVATAEHEPADLLAGALLGAAAERATPR